MNDVLTNHYTSLGFKTPKDYAQWCRDKGFSTAPNKPWRALKKEKAYVQTHVALHHLKMSNKPSTFKTFIEAYRKAPSLNTGHPFAKIIHDLTFKTPDEDLVSLFLDMLLFLDKKSKMLQNDLYIKGLWDLVTWKEYWFRPYEEWKPRSYNAQRQFSSFIRHLLAKYEVPLFMDKAWTSAQKPFLHQEWFHHIGSGKNIRTAVDLPVPLSKKAAHFFLKAPETCTIKEAFRWGQTMALGGSDRLLAAMRPTKLMGYSHNDFCLSVIKFFIDNPMLDTNQIGPIVDYIWHQKFEGERVFIERGVLRTLPPPQPNFTMTGRTVDTLMAQMERWHRQLGKEKKGGKRQWEHNKSIRDFELIEGKKENTRIWKIEELLSSNELTEEGRYMRHCVASYSGSCESGACSIWSLSLENFDGRKKMISIEVDRSKQICQMRGKNNRTPDDKEKRIIQRWCTSEGLRMRVHGWW